MKRIFNHPEPTQREQSGARYWRSTEELAQTPEVRQWLEKEFPEGASEANDADRRTFLKLMGASAGLAGLGLASGCRMPEQHILPYSKQPEHTIPGVPTYYTTSWPGPGENVPLIVSTSENRPTKLEGNPSYADYRGATNGFTQASILDLYDPDRLQHSFNKGGQGISKAQVRDLLGSLAKQYAGDGKGLAVLLEPSTSPARQRMLKALKKNSPNVKVFEYAPVSTKAQYRAIGSDGSEVRPIYRFGTARRVLALDSDFLATEVGQLKYSDGFSNARRVDSVAEAKRMNRLYAVESHYTLTGAMADHRLRAATSHIPALTALIAAEVFEQAGVHTNAAKLLRAKVKGISADPKWIKECAADLLAHKGQSLVVAGPHLPAETHQLVYAINEAIGANGKTVRYVELPKNDAGSIVDLAKAIDAGDVSTLLIVGGNPAYDAPADLDFAKKLGKVSQVIRHGYHADETSEIAGTTIAGTHYLENWGDGRTIDGTYVPVQPMILPIFEGFSELETLALLAGIDPKGQGYGLLKETFAEVTGKGDDLSFETWLAEGVWREKAVQYPEVKVKAPALEQVIARANLSAPALSAENLEFRIIPSTHAYDGRYNNNGWLMECPDTMTKLTWENAIIVSPKLAKELQITPKPIRMDEMGQLHMNANQFDAGREIAKVATLTVDGKTITGPVHILPGLADYTIVLSLGFGRRKTGRIGTELYYPNKGRGIGFDVYPFVTSASPLLAVGGQINITDKTHQLANTQEHWSMEGRAIVREGTVEEFQHEPDFAKKMGVEAHAPSNYGKDIDKPLSWKVQNQPRGGSAYDTPAFNKPDPNVPVWQGEEAEKQFLPPQQWGMNIDLNTCTACNACVIACQSENNIPIVGKDQVLRGREMHWIRLDRYFASGPGQDTTDIPEDPQVTFMSMACQHCEMAPCESVCPVNATVHDKQGLNVMAYNRCVGTRYCANNCPYKVRRFNFLDYNKRERAEIYLGPLGTNRYKTEAGQLESMARNPNVTVRMRGVMEKCTYCIQRIEMAKINQKVKAKDSADVHVPEGTIKTACQQVCAGDSITFGDLTDESSAVYKAKQSDRDYAVLGYLNIRPRTTYSAKLRNPNPKMPDTYKQPLARAEYEAKSGHAKTEAAH